MDVQGTSLHKAPIYHQKYKPCHHLYSCNECISLCREMSDILSDMRHSCNSWGLVYHQLLSFQRSESKQCQKDDRLGNCHHLWTFSLTMVFHCMNILHYHSFWKVPHRYFYSVSRSQCCQRTLYLLNMDLLHTHLQWFHGVWTNEC